ncbi:helix-turn-helix domain-containing protein [Xanthobacter autotrophicus DSM 431]|uniref:helix-turn-helix domain-containing protein n=1 Tax=Xanthobacter nonsaccharivorans TaxID=3119912 RepID=UPI003728C8F4
MDYDRFILIWNDHGAAMQVGARELERIVGVRPDVLRDWRRRGLLADIGVRKGEAWYYDRVDLLILSILKALLAEGLRIESAIDAAFGISCFVTGRLELPLDDKPDLAVVFPDQDGEISVARIEDMLGLARISCPASLVIDLVKLTRDLPEGVRNIWST